MEQLIIVLLILVLFVFFIVGCIMPPKSFVSVPSDVELKYTDGACNPAWGRTSILITANGNGIYENKDDRLPKDNFKKKFTLTHQELLELVNEIQKSGFYSLQNTYIDRSFQDGRCSFISITANNVTKEVSIVNAGHPDAYSRVAGLLSSIAAKKTK